MGIFVWFVLKDAPRGSMLGLLSKNYDPYLRRAIGSNIYTRIRVDLSYVFLKFGKPPLKGINKKKPPRACIVEIMRHRENSGVSLSIRSPQIEKLRSEIKCWNSDDDPKEVQAVRSSLDKRDSISALILDQKKKIDSLPCSNRRTATIKEKKKTESRLIRFDKEMCNILSKDYVSISPLQEFYPALGKRLDDDSNCAIDKKEESLSMFNKVEEEYKKSFSLREEDIRASRESISKGLDFQNSLPSLAFFREKCKKKKEIVKFCDSITAKKKIESITAYVKKKCDEEGAEGTMFKVMNLANRARVLKGKDVKDFQDMTREEIVEAVAEVKRREYTKFKITEELVKEKGVPFVPSEGHLFTGYLDFINESNFQKREKCGGKEKKERCKLIGGTKRPIKELSTRKGNLSSEEVKMFSSKYLDVKYTTTKLREGKEKRIVKRKEEEKRGKELEEGEERKEEGEKTSFICLRERVKKSKKTISNIKKRKDKAIIGPELKQYLFSKTECGRVLNYRVKYGFLKRCNSEGFNKYRRYLNYYSLGEKSKLPPIERERFKGYKCGDSINLFNIYKRRKNEAFRCVNEIM